MTLGNNENYNNQERMMNTMQNMNFAQMEVVQNIEKQKIEKENKFKERIAQFKDISTLEEAQELANKILPVAQELNKFRVGNAKCVVVNREDMLRISFDTEKEFISYDFSK